MLDYEKQFDRTIYPFIAGCDEAGRGPLAGPVVAAAVIMPEDVVCEEINDSKQLTDAKRRKLFPWIIEHALAYAIVAISAEKIDQINIYEASRLGMTTALSRLHHPINLILTDCMPLPLEKRPVDAIVKGDAKSFNIACASILAKVMRDNLMIQLDAVYPEYGFAKHKGYPTKEHLEALEKYGPIPHVHRYTYGPVKHVLTKQLSLF